MLPPGTISVLRERFPVKIKKEAFRTRDVPTTPFPVIKLLSPDEKSFRERTSNAIESLYLMLYNSYLQTTRYYSSSIQGCLHPIIFVDFTVFLICILSIFACFCMTRKIIVLILYSQANQSKALQYLLQLTPFQASPFQRTASVLSSHHFSNHFLCTDTNQDSDMRFNPTLCMPQFY